MPVNYSQYPANWNDEIRPSILKRDGYKCGKCSVRQRAKGYRDALGNFIECDEFMLNWCKEHGKKTITIYLSVMHLDHDITNNAPINLLSGCQQCHNRHDAKQRSFRRSANFRAKSQP